MNQHSVYIIEAQSGLVKIGHSLAPQGRAQMICAHSPVMARLIAAWPGTQQDERIIHAQFEAQRSHNEWFFNRDALAVFVEAKRGLGVEHIAEWSELSWPAAAQRKAEISERLSALAKERWQNPGYRFRTARMAAWRKAWRQESRAREAAGEESTNDHAEALSARIEAEFDARRAEFGLTHLNIVEKLR